MTAKLIISVKEVNGIAQIVYYCKERRRIYRKSFADIVREFRDAYRKANNDNIQDDFVCLGDVYINKYAIESIYLDDNGHLVDIKTDHNQYSYRFTSESSYHKYLNYLEDTCKINTMIHNQY